MKPVKQSQKVPINNFKAEELASRDQHTPREKERIAAMGKKMDKRPPKLFGKQDGDALKIQKAEGDDWGLLAAGLCEALGSADPEVQSAFIDQIKLFKKLDMDGIREINTALAILHDINPANSLEGMLAVQMVGVHKLALEMMRRTVVVGQSPENIDRNVNRASKFLRIFTAQTEALQKLRGKGQQKMTVEHVHVYQGGQAIVGNVEHKGGEGSE